MAAKSLTGYLPVAPVHTRARNNPKRHGIRHGAAVGGTMILF
ncbi:hypothetical protein ABZ260_38790 [Streptosporangium sp. NPDC006013]